MTDAHASALSDILSFWFSEKVKPKWFARDDGFDAELSRRFGALLLKAKQGELSHWADNPDGALALVILLDQLSRNIYRGTPEAFAADALALATAKQAIAKGYDLRLTSDGRGFLYMPFQHSEVACGPGGRRRTVRGPRIGGDAGLHAAAPGHHRALRALPASQRHSRAKLDSGGNRIPEAARLELLAARTSVPDWLETPAWLQHPTRLLPPNFFKAEWHEWTAGVIGLLMADAGRL